MTDAGRPGQDDRPAEGPTDNGRQEPDINEYYRRMVRLAGQTVTFRVLRAGGGTRR